MSRSFTPILKIEYSFQKMLAPHTQDMKMWWRMYQRRMIIKCMAWQCYPSLNYKQQHLFLKSEI